MVYLQVKLVVRATLEQYFCCRPDLMKEIGPGVAVVESVLVWQWVRWLLPGPGPECRLAARQG